MLLFSRCATLVATSFFFFFSFLKYNLFYNFKMVFTIFSPINAIHYLFIYFHYHPIINPAYYLFICFHYHPIINLCITKNWSVAFNATVLTLRHISCHIFFFSFLKYNLFYNFKMVFTIFNPINAAHYLFIYFHYHPIINPVHYLFIDFYYHPIINLYN